MSWEYEYTRDCVGRIPDDRMNTLPDDRNDWDSQDYDTIHKTPLRDHLGVRIKWEINRWST
jgi:hypothetical protein